MGWFSKRESREEFIRPSKEFVARQAQLRALGAFRGAAERGTRGDRRRRGATSKARDAADQRWGKR